MSTKLIAATLALLIAGSALSLMGGFGVSVTLPKKGDAGTEGAVLIVQPIGCHGPGASVTALAEGLDNGVRRSIPLKLHPLPGRTSAGAGEAFMVKREWPASGAWVLVFKASKDSMTANALVKLGRNGEVPIIDRDTSNSNQTTLLPDGKTRLYPWSFVDDEKVVAMQVVSGNLQHAVDYTLRPTTKR